MIIDIIKGITRESVFLMNAMAPYLLFGFFVAGIIHIFIDSSTIAKHLGRSNVMSVIKASLFGIPLPLCSCGVIPAAVSLRKEGASKGSILSFLISTPTTGVDSIFATYSLMGGVFAVYRIAASFITGVIAGISANIFIPDKEPGPEVKKETVCKQCHSEEAHSHTLGEKIIAVFRYAFIDLLRDAGKWILFGILIGGCIAYFMPRDFVSRFLGPGWVSMLVMLVVGVPMYVCASGSIPIAAALMLKGMSPGAAFVFLLAGPATNSVSITVITQKLGKRALFVYLAAISSCSLIMGAFLNRIWEYMGITDLQALISHRGILHPLVGSGSAILLTGLIVYTILRGQKEKP